MNLMEIQCNLRYHVVCEKTIEGGTGNEPRENNGQIDSLISQITNLVREQSASINQRLDENKRDIDLNRNVRNKIKSIVDSRN